MASAEPVTRRESSYLILASILIFLNSGHRAADCPSKPPKTCKQCGQENPDHTIEECKAKKVIDDSGVPTVTEQEAWAMIQEASSDRDVDDFKDAVKALAKAKGYEISYLDLEKELRKRKKYTVGVFKSEKCPRPILMESWPKDPADNLERLADAGHSLGVSLRERREAHEHAATVIPKIILRKNVTRRTRRPNVVTVTRWVIDLATAQTRRSWFGESCNPETKAAFQAAKAEKEGGDGNGGFDNGFDNGFGGDDSANSFKADAGNDWEVKTEPITVGGGGGW
ncbi:hypothetical protein MRB53_038888 [Persea americana]|nr:hypothetical protein MRB53_038888 [Persea americana]